MALTGGRGIILRFRLRCMGSPFDFKSRLAFGTEHVLSNQLIGDLVSVVTFGT